MLKKAPPKFKLNFAAAAAAANFTSLNNIFAFIVVDSQLRTICRDHSRQIGGYQREAVAETQNFDLFYIRVR